MGSEIFPKLIREREPVLERAAGRGTRDITYVQYNMTIYVLHVRRPPFDTDLPRVFQRVPYDSSNTIISPGPFSRSFFRCRLIRGRTSGAHFIPAFVYADDNNDNILYIYI